MNLSANLSTEKQELLYKQRIYTTGYLDRDVRQLPDLLHALNAILIDIRFMPDDRQIQWRKDYLKLLLRDKYRHVPSLGNRAENETGKTAIQNLTLGIRIITELKVNLLLMCRCRSEGDCHRRLIGRKLGEQGIETQEIRDWRL